MVKVYMSSKPMGKTSHGPLNVKLTFLIQEVPESQIAGSLREYSCKKTLYNCPRLVLLMRHQQLLTVREDVTSMRHTFDQSQSSHS